MYRMSIITLLCPPTLAAKLDIARCTRMALVHDMAEALVGDITPVDGVSKTEKCRRETETMDYICTQLLGNVGGSAGAQQAQAIRDAWQEYEDGETPESQFVHDVDKMELLLQMVEYERGHAGRLDLGEFSRVAGKIVSPEVRVWAEDVLAERRAFWEGMGIVPSHMGDVSGERKAQQDAYYGNGDGEADGVARGNAT